MVGQTFLSASCGGTPLHDSLLIDSAAEYGVGRQTGMSVPPNDSHPQRRQFAFAFLPRLSCPTTASISLAKSSSSPGERAASDARSHWGAPPPGQSSSPDLPILKKSPRFGK